MRIVSWNANRKFREKFQILDNYYHADLYIIQECEKPSETKKVAYKDFAENSLWIGHNKNMGLGVFAKKHHLLSQIDVESHYLRYMLPFKYDDQLFLGIWGHDNYVEDLIVYFSMNANFIKEQPIIMGDFNSNVIWDKKHKYRTHSAMNRDLEDMGLFSMYHYISGENQGEEKVSTYYHHRHQAKPYHIDYCYAPIDQVKRLEIGNYETWGTISDHMPMMIEI